MKKNKGFVILLLVVFFSSCNLNYNIDKVFVRVNKKLIDKIQETEQKINKEFANIEIQNAMNPIRVKPILDKVNQIQKLSNALISHIDSLKFEMIAFSEGISFSDAKKISMSDLKELENYEKSTKYLLGNDENKSKSRATELKNLINSYKQELFEIMGKDSIQINESIGTKDSYNKHERKICSWEFNNFQNTIQGISILILTKLNLHIRNAEYECIKKLNSNI